jgi:hypothetical protein
MKVSRSDFEMQRFESRRPVHPILTVAVFAIALGLLYGHAKNSSFMCEASMEGEYQEGRRITCNKIRDYSSGIGERLRSEGICP